MNDKKWYVVEQMADELTISIVELSSEEANVVRKFFNNQIVIREEDFCGTCNFYDKPFNTKEDAIYAIEQGTYY